MTKQVQRRRGTATQHTSFTGAEGELSVNTTNKSVHVHDNVTAGGFEAARADMDNVTSSSILTAAGITATTTELNYVDGVTSSIQTQLDGKAGTASPTFTGTLTTANLTATGTTTLAGASTSADITFGDNDKAIFGAGSDLQIYHDGSNNSSYIKETGAGSFNIEATNLFLKREGGTENFIDCVTNGAVTAYYDGSPKLATTSTGVDITGTLTSDGLTVDGSSTIATFLRDAGANGSLALTFPAQKATFTSLSGFKVNANGVDRLDISTVGDISFYEDTGTTAKFFWDASAEQLQIGSLDNGSNPAVLAIKSDANGHALTIEEPAGAGESWQIGVDADGDLGFYNSTSTTASVTFDDSGNVGIGTSSPTARGHFFSGTSMTQLTVDGTGGIEAGINFANGGTTYGQIYFNNVSPYDMSVMQQYIIGSLVFGTNDTERMRIDSSGNVGIGTSSPSSTLHLKDTRATLRLESESVGGTTFDIRNGVSGGGEGGISFRDITNSATRVVIDSSGNVGIGDAAPSQKLNVAGNIMLEGANQFIYLTNVGTGNSGIYIRGITADSTLRSHSTGIFTWEVTGSEKMRIDSSGNLLVGTTSVNPAGSTSAGVRISSINSQFSVSNDPVVYMNRTTSDGDIAVFRKDGTTVGSIGSEGGDSLYIQGGTTSGSGLHMHPTAGNINPARNGVKVDAAIDLGRSTHRFKDLYLSGGVYLGGTTSDNHLDDYETGYFEPNIQPASGSITWNSAYDKLSYTKIGRLVHITGQLAVSSVSSPSGITRGSLPFTQLSQDEEAERTTGIALVKGTTLNGYEFAMYPNGGSDTFLEIVRVDTDIRRDAGSYFNSSTSIYISYTYAAA